MKINNGTDFNLFFRMLLLYYHINESSLDDINIKLLSYYEDKLQDINLNSNLENIIISYQNDFNREEKSSSIDAFENCLKENIEEFYSNYISNINLFKKYNNNIK
ncbi:MAG: hypothetical protein LBM02_09670 [Lachnospiraceae bacterium]|jgi:hypothetical protein|nr:hypothetical protein [Lachnospiraceae bacterium]